MKHFARLALFTAALLIPSAAFAQKPTAAIAGVTLTGNLNKDAQAVWAKILGANATDLAYASAMANAAGTPGAKVRKQCIDAIIVANAQATGANVKNADGSPMTRPDPHAISDVESFAETVDNLSAQGPLVTNCAGAAQLLKLNTLQLINGIVTGVAAFGVLPPIPIP